MYETVHDLLLQALPLVFYLLKKEYDLRLLKRTAKAESEAKLNLKKKPPKRKPPKKAS